MIVDSLVFQLQDSNKAFSGKAFDWDANKGFFKNLSDKVFIKPSPEQIALVKSYNDSLEDLTLNKEKFLSTLDDTDPLKAYFTTLDGGIASQNGMTAALNKTTLSSKAAAAGMKVLSVAMNMVVMAGALFVAQKTVELLDNLTHRTENAAKKVDELASEYKDLKSEVDSLNQELKTTHDRMSELESLNHLTLTEQDEYNRLVATNEELERQLKIKKSLAESARIEAGEAALKAYGNKKEIGMPGWLIALLPALENINRQGFLGLGVGDIGLTNEEAAQKHIDQLEQLIAKREMINESYEKGILSAQGYEYSLSNVTKEIDEQKGELAPYAEELKNLYDALSDDTLEQRELKVHIGSLLDDIADTIEESAPNIQESFDRIFSEISFKGLDDKLLDLAKSGRLTENIFDQSTFSELGDALSSAGIKISDVTEHFYALAEAELSAKTTTNDVKYSTEELAKILSDTTDSLSGLAAAYKEQSENGQLSTTTLATLMEKHSDWIDLISIENGVIKLNSQAVLAKAQATIQGQIEELTAVQEGTRGRIAQYEAEIAKLQQLESQSLSTGIAAGLALGFAGRSEKNRTAIQDAEDYLSKLSVTIEALKGQLNQLGTSDPFGNLKSSAKDAEKSISEEFSKAYTHLQYLRDHDIISEYQYYNELAKLRNQYFSEGSEEWERYELEIYRGIKALKEKLAQEQQQKKEAALKAEGQAAIDEIDKRIKKQQEALDASNDYYDNEIKRLKELKDTYKEANDKRIEELEKQKDAQSEAIQAQIDAINAQREAEEEARLEQEKLLAIEEARQKLAQLKSQKSVRIYKKGQGFVYDVDYDAIEEQQGVIDDLEKEWKEYQEKKTIEKEIKRLKDLKSETEKSFDAQIKKLRESTTAHTERIDKQIENLERLKEQDAAAIQEQITNLEELKTKWQEAVSHIGETLEEHQAHMKYAAEFEDMTFGQMSDAADGFAGRVEDAMQKTKDSIQDMLDELDDALEEAKRVEEELNNISYKKPSSGSSGSSGSKSNSSSGSSSSSNSSTHTSSGGKTHGGGGISFGGNSSSSSPNKGTSSGSSSSPSKGTSSGSSGSPSKGTSSGSSNSSPNKGTSSGSSSSPNKGTSSGSSKSPNKSTSSNTSKKKKSSSSAIKKKASGAKYIDKADIYNVDENGEELIVRKPEHGRYVQLEKGDGVVPADITKRIWDLVLNVPDISSLQIASGMNKFQMPTLKTTNVNKTEKIENHYHISKLEFPNVKVAEEIEKAIIALPSYSRQVSSGKKYR